MSITNELREWMDRTTARFDGRRYLLGTDEELTAIADRIDAEHEAQLNDAFETRNSDENLESDGWVRLPVDADGVPIRVGDVMEGTCPSGKHVNGTVNAIGDGVFWISNVQFSLKPDYMHHYHAPTVEDVLREMLYKAHIYDRQEMELLPDLIAEYATKLRLASNEE